MDTPLITLWEMTPPKGKGNTVRLTSTPPVRVQQTPFPQRGVWVDGTPWYCCGVDVGGVERTSGQVPAIILTVKLNEYTRARKNTIMSVGTRVTRYVTDALAAEGMNWADGTNPYGTPQQTNHRIDRWVITRTLEETLTEVKAQMQGERAFWGDLVRPDVPGRCYHTYRGAACGYTGTSYWDATGKSVANAEDDVCGLRVKDCKLRYPSGAIPFGEG